MFLHTEFGGCNSPLFSEVDDRHHFPPPGPSNPSSNIIHPTHHSRVQLDGHHLLGLFQQLHGQVTRSGPNLQDDIRGLEARLVHDRLHHQGILQNVLALGLVELDACTCAYRGCMRVCGNDKGRAVTRNSAGVEALPNSPEKPFETFLAPFLATPPAARRPDMAPTNSEALVLGPGGHRLAPVRRPLCRCEQRRQ